LELSGRLPENLQYPVTFEVISHRYTSIAKERILQVFPDTSLPMEEEGRQFKYGQFGYGKYVYSKETINQVKEFFAEEIGSLFKDKKLLYII
jgi:spore photoproduct lyase